MGNKNKETVQLVISHLEGSSGNFLGRLFADCYDKNQSLFRTDTTFDPRVLAIDGVDKWDQELSRLREHRVIVTHNFDLQQISKYFPNAKIIQIYPYTHIGNVLYNICFKKLNRTLDNLVDNHLLHIVEWYNHIQQRRPVQDCIDSWQLTDQQTVENLLEIKFSKSQEQFFNLYWEHQLAYSLTIPDSPLSIEELVSFWKIENYFNDWSIAWTIFVYELINQRLEHQRAWSVDVDKFNSWDDLAKIQTRYNNNLTLPTD
jgi:hypothetical protein